MALLVSVAGFALQYVQYRDTKPHVRISLSGPRTVFGEGCPRLAFGFVVANRGSTAITLGRPYWSVSQRLMPTSSARPRPERAGGGLTPGPGTRTGDAPLLLESHTVAQFELDPNQAIRRFLGGFPPATRIAVTISDFDGHTWRVENAPQVGQLAARRGC